MILIADGGSTKTDWCLQVGNDQYERIKTSGINPYYQSEEEIANSLMQEFSLPKTQIEQIFFYGAGCANAKKNAIVQSALNQCFKTKNIEINSDLLGAARSLCQEEEGIACIMGTGSNSCHYKGGKIVKNVSPLGYRLGDEGSGAVIGEKLVSDILKKQLSASTTEMFFARYQITADEIIENVYRKKFPNRYLAQFTKFIFDNPHIKELEDIVLFCFDDFVRRNLLQYDRIMKIKVNFTGSIAFHFQPQLLKTMQKYKLTIGKISSAPMEGLMAYHGVGS